ncbi:adhesion G-protein coupled receptor D1-like [Stylophora pistillata]|uniref:adhesion G-protein coupled receptor D1-like n=1 Tax=Stylophora pistillata TaxID=50429 RepID=UPI000C0490AD|nr:adhesion G-protein coupled receptor D1-like [Stylophora pistillata]XP_022804294.1 adhesion G-protein coupled receptor D1-like [Stylophora pistillata]
MWLLFGFLFVSYAAGYIEANEYSIHNASTLWSGAVENCQRNGSVLAVLDSQHKIDQLTSSFLSQGNNRKNKYWIGLRYNGSTEHYVWSSGVLADKVSVTNSICGKHQTPLNQKDWCYLVKESPSVCFEKRECNKSHRYGYICQPVTDRVSPTTSSSPAPTVQSVDLKVDQNPLSKFSSVMSSLNPKDPFSLKLATNAFKGFAESLKSEHDKREKKINLIYSTQIVEEFAFKYGSFNLNATKSEERTENEHIVLQVSLVPRGYHRSFTFTGAVDLDEVARITLPSYLFQTNDTIAVNTLYRDLHEFLDNLGSREDKIHSMILGSDVGPSKQKIFRENVTIVFRTLEEKGKYKKSRLDCVFWQWNYSLPANGSWSNDGCSLVESNATHVVCTCNHLTNFAILMNIEKHEFSEGHKEALSYMTYIGVGISLLGETVTFIAYLLVLCSSHEQQSHVHINLVATLAVAQSIFLAGINATQNQVLCITVAAMIHYFYLSSFCWMLIEGVMLYLLIIEVYNTELKLRLCYLFSLGCPGLIVGGTLIFASLNEPGINQYITKKWCWLSTENYYIWSFAGPVVVISFVNIVVFCIVVKEMVNMTSIQSNKFSRVKTTVKACIVLFPLLGVTWLFGLLSMINSSVASQYIFTLLNSLQGLMIFIFHCARNSEVKLVWSSKLKRMKKRACRFIRIRIHSQTNTCGENNSDKNKPSEVELARRKSKIAPVEG